MHFAWVLKGGFLIDGFLKEHLDGNTFPDFATEWMKLIFEFQKQASKWEEAFMEDRQTEQEVHDGLRIASYLISDDHTKLMARSKRKKKCLKEHNFSRVEDFLLKQ